MERKFPLSSYSVALGTVALAFLAGITAGCLFAARGGAEADGAVADYLLPIAGNIVPGPTVGRALMDVVLYPALCFLFGFAIPGVVLIPVTVCARGFFVSYAIASCARVFGAWNGTVFSLSLMGLPLLLSLPALFWLGAQGFLNSKELLGSALRKQNVSIKGKENFRRFGVALSTLVAAAAAELYLSPLLATYAASKL
ncbi:MAG: stage II sporulation protein M [Oscillospiraceae bacterium]|nr:stage II sporulation protein M [Oscillospiraceae bacterium]